MLISSPPRVPCSTSHSSPVVGLSVAACDVAVAERPDLRPHAFLADERIVFRDRAVGVDAHDLAEQAVHPLRLHAPFGDRSLAQRDEQRAVAAEDQAAAEVQRRVAATAPGERSPGHPRRAAPRRRPGGRARPPCCSRRRRAARRSSSRSDGSSRSADRARRRAGRPGRAHRPPAGPATGSDSLPSAPTIRSRPGASRSRASAVGQERHAPRILQSFGDRDDVEGDVGRPLGRARLAGKRRASGPVAFGGRGSAPPCGVPALGVWALALIATSANSAVRIRMRTDRPPVLGSTTDAVNGPLCPSRSLVQHLRASRQPARFVRVSSPHPSRSTDSMVRLNKGRRQ